jgi:hypothetical protein
LDFSEDGWDPFIAGDPKPMCWLDAMPITNKNTANDFILLDETHTGVCTTICYFFLGTPGRHSEWNGSARLMYSVVDGQTTPRTEQNTNKRNGNSAIEQSVSRVT